MKISGNPSANVVAFKAVRSVMKTPIIDAVQSKGECLVYRTIKSDSAEIDPNGEKRKRQGH